MFFYWQSASLYCLDEDTAMLSLLYTTIFKNVDFVVIISYLEHVCSCCFINRSFFIAVSPLYPQESIKLHLICTVAAKFVHSASHFNSKQIAVWGKLMKVLVES